jgi:hypothetical protein
LKLSHTYARAVFNRIILVRTKVDWNWFDDPIEGVEWFMNKSDGFFGGISRCKASSHDWKIHARTGFVRVTLRSKRENLLIRIFVFFTDGRVDRAVNQESKRSGIAWGLLLTRYQTNSKPKCL